MGQSGHILIVDDEPQICRVLHAILVEQRFEVLLVHRGDKALQLIRSGHIDLILLDLNLPDIPGTELCRAIRAASDAVIIVLTVRTHAGDKVALLDAGADDYVTKPFDASVLLARIRAKLRRHRPTQELETFVTRDWSVDFGARTVVREQKNIRLPRKEYQLLRYLMSHRGESLSHHALLEALWGQDYREESGILHVVILKLRKKIEPDPSLPRYIVTIPWFGYRFESPLEETEPSGSPLNPEYDPSMHPGSRL